MDGVKVTPLKRIATGKGDVLHAMKATDEGYCGFGEVYFSEVYSGQKKGWKRHNRMTLNLVVVKGAIRFIIVNDKTNEREEVVLSPDGNYARLTVAPGLWMAFEGVAEGVSLLMDLIPEPHDPEESDRRDEL
ncbi:MAG: WxcM-like domain-containing protein [Paludibacteraceae bacterium]|nr:WxcM-like domain-containing protein [Paludibacteraceae bacterium]